MPWNLATYDDYTGGCALEASDRLNTGSNSAIIALQYVGRWLLVLPAAIVLALLAYLVSTIANSFGGFMVSGFVGIFASGTAGYIAVAAAGFIAPNAKRGAAMAMASIITLAGVFAIANASSGDVKTTYPLWYSIVLFSVVVIGALIGISIETTPPMEFPIAAPRLVRWLLFLPLAFVCAVPFIACFIALSLNFPGLSSLLQIEDIFVGGIIMCGVATAIAPSGKRIVVSIIGGFWALWGFAVLVGTIFRPLIKPIMEAKFGYHIDFSTPGAMQGSIGLAYFLAGAIPIYIIFARERCTKNEASSY